MSEALFERYKEALRRGHVASQRGRFDEALDAYTEAAKVAPDRALPLVGIGLVLTRLDKTTEALSAFDLALDRAPTDETALRGRIDTLLAMGDRARAADMARAEEARLAAAARTLSFGPVIEQVIQARATETNSTSARSEIA